MSEYKIQINHNEGCSLGDDDKFTDLEFTWTDKSIVEENIRRIKEHYDFVCATDVGTPPFNPKEVEKVIDSFRHNGLTYPEIKNKLSQLLKDKPWYVYSGHCWEYSLKLITPNGKEYTQQVFWHGYHDCLYDVSIKESLIQKLRSVFH